MASKRDQLKILLVEDSEDDAELIAMKLREEGFRFDLKRIESEKEMNEALQEESWDLIITDYLLPSFNGIEVLKLAKKVKEDIPVVTVSGKVGEERAVEILKEGASDFVMKDNLSRLPIAVGRALKDARFRREKQKTDDEFRKVANRYHMLAENILDIIWTMDTDKRITFVSPSVSKLIGYSVPEILKLGLNGIFVPAHYPEAYRAIDRVLSSFENKNAEFPGETFEAQVICQGGSHIWTETRLTLLLGPGDRLIGFLGVTRDISDRKRSEKMLRDSESRLRLIMEHTPDAVFTTDLEGKITFINKGFFGRKVEDIVGGSFFDRVERPDPSQIKKIFHKVQKSGESSSLEIKAKNERWWYARLIPVKKEEEVDQILFISSDITEMKETERDRLSMSQAVEQLEEGIIITDTDRKIRFVNETFEKNSGFTEREITGKPIDILWEVESDEKLKERNRSVFMQAESWKGKLTLRKKSGKGYEAEIRISPIRNREGKITSYVIIEQDITEELELEEQFHRMQKMEALGTLAGGIAHDFNNILMPVIINTELLLWETSKENPAHRYLEQTLEAAHRGRDLVKQILTYSRAGGVEKRTLDMVQTVKEILRFLGASLPARIEIQEHSSVGSYLVNADPVQIQQVLMNIFKNAADAIGPNEGRIMIHLSHQEVAPGDKQLLPNLEPGPYLNISISDTGCGMDKKTASKIFDPFFSTKKPAEGTGMGLAVAQKIIKNHQGDIRFSSEKGKGSVFQIFLPQASSSMARKEPMDESIPKGRERVLLVDDEEDIVQSLKRLLERLGYMVTEVTRAGEAMKMIQEENRNFDLVITDLVMPGMSGLDLAQELKKTGSRIPVILITGFAESIDPEEAKKAGIQELMMKPISSGGIAQAIRRVLDAQV